MLPLINKKRKMEKQTKEQAIKEAVKKCPYKAECLEEGYKLAQKENINEIIENSNAIQLLAISKLAELNLNKLSWNSSKAKGCKKRISGTDLDGTYIECECGDFGGNALCDKCGDKDE